MRSKTKWLPLSGLIFKCRFFCCLRLFLLFWATSWRSFCQWKVLDLHNTCVSTWRRYKANPVNRTVFELKAFVNNELNITTFAACTWEHNRREMHRYNLNKSIHSVNNIDERRSDQSKNEFFCQKYSQAKIRLLVTLTSLRKKKKKQGSPVSISLQNISI